MVEIKQPLLHHGSERQEGSVQTQRRPEAAVLLDVVAEHYPKVSATWDHNFCCYLYARCLFIQQGRQGRDHSPQAQRRQEDIPR